MSARWHFNSALAANAQYVTISLVFIPLTPFLTNSLRTAKYNPFHAQLSFFHPGFNRDLEHQRVQQIQHCIWRPLQMQEPQLLPGEYIVDEQVRYLQVVGMNTALFPSENFQPIYITFSPPCAGHCCRILVLSQLLLVTGTGDWYPSSAPQTQEAVDVVSVKLIV